jgi:hypothetical protein
MSLQLKIILGISKKLAVKYLTGLTQLTNQARFYLELLFALKGTLKIARNLPISIVLINSLNPWGYFCNSPLCI